MNRSTLRQAGAVVAVTLTVVAFGTVLHSFAAGASPFVQTVADVPTDPPLPSPTDSLPTPVPTDTPIPIVPTDTPAIAPTATSAPHVNISGVPSAVTVPCPGGSVSVTLAISDATVGDLIRVSVDSASGYSYSNTGYANWNGDPITVTVDGIGQDGSFVVRAIDMTIDESAQKTVVVTCQ
jgi:hypothetical protein